MLFIPIFFSLPQTIHTLFFSIFGLISLDKLAITPPEGTEVGVHGEWYIYRISDI